MLPLVKESPIWLLKRGRENDARTVYSYLRNLPPDHVYIVEDLAFICGQIAGEREISNGGDPTFMAFLRGAAKESCMKGMRNRYALVFVMFMWQAWSGAAAINYCKALILRLTFTSRTANPNMTPSRLPDYFYLNWSYRCYPLDRYIWSNQSSWINNFLYVFHRQIWPQVALDYLFYILRFVSVLLGWLYCGG